MSTLTKLLGYLQRPCFDPLCIEKKMTSFFPIKPQSMTHIHSGFPLQFLSCGVSWLRTKILVIKKVNKGQEISEGNCGVFNSPKKHEKILNFCPGI